MKHDEKQSQRENEAKIESENEEINVLNGIPAFSNTDATPLEMTIENDDQKMEIDEIISNPLSPIEIHYRFKKSRIFILF